MSQDEIFDFIGDLAIALYTKGIKIDLASLGAILRYKGVDVGEDYNIGISSMAADAYWHWKGKDIVIQHAIAFTYRNKYGDLAWDK